MRPLQELIEKISLYHPQADFDLLRKAYVYASKVHKGQTRKSGEAYISHPQAVASLLVDLKLDIPSIATGFLHDTVEDTQVTLDEIRDLFGDEVAFLVDGVTKIGKISFSSRAEHQAENFRKMLVAMAKDIRVILIKLADRLHNMRTLHHLSEAKREEISRETTEIYSPLANRLGIHWIRVELEDLAFRYLKPQVCEKLEKQMRRFGKEKEKYIDDVVKILEEKLQVLGIRAQVTGRLKNLSGIYKKMEMRGITFEEVNDIIAFRIIVDDVGRCYEVLGHVHALWKPVPGRFKDFIAMPKENLYQSLHTTLIGPLTERIEIQIRTQEMHQTAEEGIAAHWKYKENDQIGKKDEAHFRWLRQLLEWQQELKDPTEFLQSIKDDLFEENVYAFTPKGEVKALSKGATPIDFAYAIHTDVGNQCVGAKVSGRIVPLKYQIKSGDVVEILTQKNSKPKKDWLSIAVTSRALNRIRGVIQKEEKQKAIEMGQNLFEIELKKFNLNPQKVLKEDGINDFIRRNNQGNISNLFANIALGHVTLKHLLQSILPKEMIEKLDQGGGDAAEKSDSLLGGALSKVFGKMHGGKSTIRVGGQNDVLIHYGQCCNPLPGDEIVGFVTRGRGVTIHTAECREMLSQAEERRIKVEWEGHVEGLHTARIRTFCIDQPGLLAKISKAITHNGANIIEAQCKTNQDLKAVNLFTIQIQNLNQLRHLTKSIEEIEGVISVERVRQL